MGKTRISEVKMKEQDYILELKEINNANNETALLKIIARILLKILQRLPK